jgi:hypothetical protein
MPRHRKTFRPASAVDHAAIDLGFNKRKTSERKAWVDGLKPDTHPDYSRAEVSITDFVHEELILHGKFTLNADLDPISAAEYSLCLLPT